mmetsp:Transcript_18807/g.34951  ORF Transcript_18807/g.34951 Transcript_18807/m.34951 type:complete len:83 (+) Transcript_18807:124-372(+)
MTSKEVPCLLFNPRHHPKLRYATMTTHSSQFKKQALSQQLKTTSTEVNIKHITSTSQDDFLLEHHAQCSRGTSDATGNQHQR